jgi:hypothetical protein
MVTLKQILLVKNMMTVVDLFIIERLLWTEFRNQLLCDQSTYIFFYINRCFIWKHESFTQKMYSSFCPIQLEFTPEVTTGEFDMIDFKQNIFLGSCVCEPKWRIAKSALQNVLRVFVYVRQKTLINVWSPMLRDAYI